MGTGFIEVSHSWLLHFLKTGSRWPSGRVISNGIPSDSRISYIELDPNKEIVRIQIVSSEFDGNIGRLPKVEFETCNSIPDWTDQDL